MIKHLLAALPLKNIFPNYHYRVLFAPYTYDIWSWRTLDMVVMVYTVDMVDMVDIVEMVAMLYMVNFMLSVPQTCLPCLRLVLFLSLN
jgi:hypothetical protein